VATEVKLPRLGQGMESGTIVRWLVSEGEPVKKGDPLYEVDTEKVTQEVEAEADGVLLKITVQEGEVPVGEIVAFIGSEGESVPERSGNGAGPAEAPAEAEPAGGGRGGGGGGGAPARDRGREAAAAEASAHAAPATQSDGGRIKASPLARRIARERGVDLAQLRGTGPEGRIVAEDVERAEAQPATAPAAAPAPTFAPGEVEVVELTSIRKTIARRMTEAWQAPVFQISMSADMTRANELRARLVERLREGEAKPTVSDILTKAAAVALMRHREVNATFHGDAIHLHPAANVGMAVATDRGLVVPVIPSAERRTIQELAQARVEVVGRARGGKLQQSDLEGGTFTISNLGMFGVEQFVAVLNPPQVAILAVGAAEEKPVVRDGELLVVPLMTLTLTCDHRAIDGATASDFLGTVRAILEDPALAL
jgi:pyruvate dehydrogenase E2 component (dihydrolipoamide acetyltransferase)